MHIRERHSIDYELFEKYGAQCVQNSDYIIKDTKNENTSHFADPFSDY